LFEEEAVVSTS